MRETKKYLLVEVQKRTKPLLVALEFMAVSAFLSVKYYKQLEWDTYTLILAGFVTAVLMSQLFFRVRWFRYLFSVIFSLFWGLLAFMLVRELTTSTIICWITFGLIVLISLSIHKEYFKVGIEESDTT